MRSRFLAVVLGVVVAVAVVAPPAYAQVTPEDAEQGFLALVNGTRAAKGLRPLVLHDELTAIARSWAANMAAEGRISHNPALAKQVQAPWERLGENVGLGTTVDDLHDAFVASPTHYKNIADAGFDHIGIGVAVGRDGTLYTAHEFMQLGSAPEPPPAPAPSRRPAPAPAPALRPPATTVPPAPAPVPEPVGAPPSLPDQVGEAGPAPAAPVPATPPARLVLVLRMLGELDEA